MRIMLVISSLRRGGAERIVSIIANYWSAHGHEVYLVTVEGQETDAYSVNSGVRRIGLNLARKSDYRLLGLWNNLHRIWRLRTTARRVSPDVIVSFVTHTNLLVLIAMLGVRIPVIASERIDPSQIWLGTLREKLRCWLYPRAVITVVQTDRVRVEMQRMLPLGRFVMIPNPVPMSDPDEGQACVPMHKLLRLPPDAKVVAAMGRLDPQKGFDLLIEAFGRLSHQHSAWHLVIFGEGAARSDLEAQVTRLGLTARVHLPGVVRNSRRSLAEADLFVLSSRFEGFPNVLLEAMACRLAVVSFDCPSGPGEIIRDRQDGLLVPAGSIEKLEAAMSLLMESPTWRKKLGQNACQVLERFSMDRIMTLWDRVIAESTSR